MEQLGKVIAFAGLGLAAVGGILFLLGRAGFRGLPGDVRYETENVRVYFPIATSIALSVVLSLAMWAWNWMSRK
jgi:hypothetical protein